MTIRKKTTCIVIHHTGHPLNTTAADIDSWHKKKGWAKIGYHFHIDMFGKPEHGRQLDQVGAHCKRDGLNHCSVGIVLAGDFNKQIPLPAQMDALYKLIDMLATLYDLDIDDNWDDVVFMHRYEDETNPCPGVNFQKIFRGMTK